MKDKPIGRGEQDRLLDEALEETFPASDPVSMQQNCIVGAVSRPHKPAAKRRKVKRPAPEISVVDIEPG